MYTGVCYRRFLRRKCLIPLIFFFFIRHMVKLGKIRQEMKNISSLYRTISDIFIYEYIWYSRTKGPALSIFFEPKELSRSVTIQTLSLIAVPTDYHHCFHAN